MDKKLTFKLIRPAKRSGGDRYEHGTKGDEDHIVVYVPQFLSRAANGQVVAEQIIITFEPV